MLAIWLRRNYNVKRFGELTWTKLVNTVKHMAGGRNPLPWQLPKCEILKVSSVVLWVQYSNKSNSREDGGSPTTTGWLSSRLLFIQQNIVGSCSPNMPQISRGKLPKLLIYIQCFDQCGLLQVSINQTHYIFYRQLTTQHIYTKSRAKVHREQ